MSASWNTRLNRRAAVGGGLAGIAGLASPAVGTARGRAIIQRGMVGGGRVRLAQGEADFSVFASRLIIDDEDPGSVRGSVRWVDAAADLSMHSVRISDYQDLELPPRQGEGRRITGVMRVSGAGEQPFVLDVIDAGAPGSGRDTVEFTVGARDRAGDDAAGNAGFRYRAEGAIVSGDVQAVEFEIPGGAGTKCRRASKKRRRQART